MHPSIHSFTCGSLGDAQPPTGCESCSSSAPLLSEHLPWQDSPMEATGKARHPRAGPAVKGLIVTCFGFCDHITPANLLSCTSGRHRAGVAVPPPSFIYGH